MALDYISETLTTCNQILKESPVRKERWEVVRTDEKSRITSIGKVMFSKTLFKNKVTGERRYLPNANENPDLVKKFGIMQAPTLVIENGDSFQMVLGVSDIKSWIQSSQVS